MTLLQDAESPAVVVEQPVALKPYLWTYAALWLVSAVALVLFTNSYFPTADPSIFGALPIVAATASALRFTSRERRPMTPSERVKFSIRAAACAIAASLIPAALALVFDSAREVSALDTWVLPLMTALLFLPAFFLNYLTIFFRRDIALAVHRNPDQRILSGFCAHGISSTISEKASASRAAARRWR